MKFSGICIMVEDMARAKDFYIKALGQQLVMDLDQNVTFAGGFSLQSEYERLMGIPTAEVTQRSNSFELYFEEDDLDGVAARLQAYGAEFVHGKQERPWGQFCLLVRDPDGHLIEVAETMPGLVGRLMAGGMTPEQVSQRTSLPLPAVQEILQYVK